MSPPHRRPHGWILGAMWLLACQGSRAEPETGPTAPEQPVTIEAVAPAEPAMVVSPALRYQLPPPDVREIVEAPPTPTVSLSSDGRTMLLADHPALPGIEVLAEPMHGLAGERINPRTNERRRTVFYERLTLVDVANGQRREVGRLPDSARLGAPNWAPDGRHVAFTHTTHDHVEAWVLDVARGEARRLLAEPLNATFGAGMRWLSGSERMLVSLVPSGRGPAPIESPIAGGPLIDETSGRAATNRTYQDLLETPLDDALFDYYFGSELAIVQIDGTLTKLGGVGVYASLSSSPDGRWLLVERLLPPYSRIVPWSSFAHRIELWSLSDPSAPPIVLAELPAAEEVPIQGVPTGPRGVYWQPLVPATLIWAEALDGGDPRREVEHRDRLLRLAAPFEGKRLDDGQVFTRLEHRYGGIRWLQQPGRYLISEYDRDRKWSTTYLRELPERELPPAHAESLGRVLFDRSIHDSYNDPGSPVTINLPDDTWVVRIEGEGDEAALFLDGEGATPDGDRPFLDRLALAPDSKPERLFESPADSWASFASFVGDTNTLVLRREGPHDPPDWFRHTLADDQSVALTELPHPHPELDGMDKQLLTYERADGVPLSATLYTPPGFDRESGERLPLVIWAYPLEYLDASTAGQVRAAPTRFTRLGGTSATMFLTQGYAVMLASMPVVGDPETMNDTLLEQLEQAAEAAIDEAVAVGVADRGRVGVAGHSYGAFMVANLLAHTDLFKAGIARSGAYNRSFTPFGFQSERRTLWEAPEAYVEVSPLFAAAELDEPILLVHGEIDDNPGTYPMQTRRLFHALQGLGGTARMVILPHESHGYQARESVLHLLYESFRWFDLHVKHVEHTGPSGMTDTNDNP
jgi:dipeptidyl aminopeptidase/acylaminoacyl peptidase